MTDGRTEEAEAYEGLKASAEGLKAPALGLKLKEDAFALRREDKVGWGAGVGAGAGARG